MVFQSDCCWGCDKHIVYYVCSKGSPCSKHASFCCIWKDVTFLYVCIASESCSCSTWFTCLRHSLRKQVQSACLQQYFSLDSYWLCAVQFHCCWLFIDCTLDCLAKKCLSLFGRESSNVAAWQSTCTIKIDGVIISHCAQRSIDGLLTAFAVNVSIILCVNYLPI